MAVRFESSIPTPFITLSAGEMWYLFKRKEEHFIEYELVLGEYGGDMDTARRLYQKSLIEEMDQGKELHDQVIGQTVIGGEEFVDWLRTTFLAEEKIAKITSERLMHSKQSS